MFGTWMAGHDWRTDGESFQVLPSRLPHSPDSDLYCHDEPPFAQVNTYAILLEGGLELAIIETNA